MSSTEHMYIKLYGVFYWIKGTYTPAEPGDYEYPGSPAKFEIDSCGAIGSEACIRDFLKDSIVAQLQEMALDKYNGLN